LRQVGLQWRSFCETEVRLALGAAGTLRVRSSTIAVTVAFAIGAASGCIAAAVALATWDRKQGREPEPAAASKGLDIDRMTADERRRLIDTP
jgi:hypothetical protein